MHRGSTAGSTTTIGWRTWLLAALGVGALLVPAMTAGAASAETTWLCKPGLANNPCESSEETTVENADGTTSNEQAQPASNPPIDCFYVYPTVSNQSTVNANLEIGTEEKQVAIDQASRFSQQCKVYAPMYPQVTLKGITEPEGIVRAASAIAYEGVATAFAEYMAKYNDGRGFVLIGHSQGALQLKQLIKEEIDPVPELRNQLVSAMLFGGNVLVPKGGIVGGDFQHIPACQAAGQTHCVVAYSSFLREPPLGAVFGRVKSALLGPTTPEQEANDEVLCVNPALAVQGVGAGPLLRYESTTPLPGPGFTAPPGPTPWVSMPGQYTGECKHANGASWLQLTNVGGAHDEREPVTELEVLGADWGTHPQDVNVALGNLVAMTAAQSATYQAENPPPPSPAPTPVPAPPPTALPPATPLPSLPALHKVAKPVTHHPVKHKKPARHGKHGKHGKHAAKHKTSAHKRPTHGHKSAVRKHERPAH